MGKGTGFGEGTGFGLGSGAGLGLGEGAGSGGGGDTHVRHVMIELVSNVTAPVWASARPVSDDPVVTVILTAARMFPRNVVPVPRVAELPTTQ